MSRNFNEEIEKSKQSLQSALPEMNDLQEKFIISAIDFMKPFWESKAIEVVKDEPEFAKELGKEKLSELKQEVKELEARTQEVVRTYLENNKVWWHRDQSIGYRSGNTLYHHSEFVNDPPAEQDNALRFAAGELAKLVEKYGFLKTKVVSYSAKGWKPINKKGGSYPRNEGDAPFYPFDWSWTSEMARAMFDYHNLRLKFQSMEKKLKELKTEKEKSEAENLWNEA